MNGISSIIGISGRTAVQTNFKSCIIDFINLSFLATQALPVHPGIKENQDVADTLVDTILVRRSWQRSGRQATKAVLLRGLIQIPTDSQYFSLVQNPTGS